MVPVSDAVDLLSRMIIYIHAISTDTASSSSTITAAMAYMKSLRDALLAGLHQFSPQRSSVVATIIRKDNDDASYNTPPTSPPPGQVPTCPFSTLTDLSAFSRGFLLQARLHVTNIKKNNRKMIS
jgi:hypothetical protein